MPDSEELNEILKEIKNINKCAEGRKAEKAGSAA